MQSQHVDVAVIGGGPGGYSAALYCARSGLQVAVLEKLSPGGQMSTTGKVENYPGFDEGIDGYMLGERMKKGAERFGVQTVFAEVKRVWLSDTPKKLETSDGTLTADAVILSTGASPRELGLPEERALRGRGVAYCAICDGMFYRGKTVAIVGGGNSAVGDALFLAKLCEKVYLVHRRDQLRASAVNLAALEQSGVELIWNSKLARLYHEKHVTGVQVENIKTGKTYDLRCEGVFVAVGRVPDTALFRGQVETDEAGYLVADESTRTNLPGVFAVGDVRTKPVRQIVTAASDGAVAAYFIEEYLKELKEK